MKNKIFTVKNQVILSYADIFLKREYHFSLDCRMKILFFLVLHNLTHRNVEKFKSTKYWRKRENILTLVIEDTYFLI